MRTGSRLRGGPCSGEIATGHSPWVEPSAQGGCDVGASGVVGGASGAMEGTSSQSQSRTVLSWTNQSSEATSMMS